MAEHRVVIQGGESGGLHAAKELKSAPVGVTLIDRRNYHLFQPLLYQMATGSLPLERLRRHCAAFLIARKILAFSWARPWTSTRRIILRDGASLEYDSLIVATGSESAYFGNDTWREWAPSLKSVEEATAARHKILYAFEAAERVSDARERLAWLTSSLWAQERRVWKLLESCATACCMLTAPRSTIPAFFSPALWETVRRRRARSRRPGTRTSS